jgi:UDPglucose 6-dehydrogenase
MAALAARVGASSGLAEATDLFNRAQIKSLAELVKQHHAADGAIGILGLTYKPDTDVVEESFGLLLAQELSAANLRVVAYDPSADAAQVLGTNKGVRIASSASECIEGSSVVVVATPWQEFRDLTAKQWAPADSGAERTVIDCWRVLNHLDGAQRIRYVRLGFGGEAAIRSLEATSAAD